MSTERHGATGDIIFQSDRRFFVLSYSASHGLSLIRSHKSASDQTRLDILFQDVRVMELRCWFDGVQVRERDREYLDSFRSKPTEMLEPGNKTYSVHSSGWDGFIVGGQFSSHEDDGDRMTESALLRANSEDVIDLEQR